MQGWEFPQQFLSKSLFFCLKMSEGAIHSKKDFKLFSQNFLSESLIPSFIMSNLSESLTFAHLS